MFADVDVDATGHVDELVGRGRETQALGALVSQLRVCGAAKILRGQVGVGKSVLLATAAGDAEGRGIQVWRACGVRAERGVPFAGLNQILRPLLERADGLPQPHRACLLASFGRDSHPPRDTFSVALATLELLGEVAKRAPVMIAIDDAHWIDRETAQVLGFVGRRLSQDPVALLLAIRDGYPTDVLNFGIPELEVGALDEESSAALLAATAPRLSLGLSSRVLAESDGNPLALVELPAAAQSGALMFGRPDRLPTTKRLRNAFTERFLDLPLATRALLLVTSLDDDATFRQVLAATAVMGDGCGATVDDLGPAFDSGLVEQGNARLQFGHPLTPAAIYDSSTAYLRDRAHAALATVLADRPGRRAWHLAASVTDRDEEISNELELAAMSSEVEHRPNWRIAALERAADLSVELADRLRRLLAAGELALDLGQLCHAERLLNEMRPQACEPPDQARMELLRDMVEVGFVRDARAVEGLTAAGLQAGTAGEKILGLRLIRAAATRSWWAGLGPEVRARISTAAHRVAAGEDQPELLSILAMSDPEGSDAAIRRAESRTPPSLCDAGTALALGSALHFAGAFDRSVPYLAEAIRALRRQAYVWPLPEALALQAWNRIYADNLGAAFESAREAVLVAGDLRQPLWQAMGANALSVVYALRGNSRDAESSLAAAERIAVPIGARTVLADTQLARAIIAFSAGNYEEAFEHLERTFDPRDPAHHYQRSAWRIGELAEAAVHAGRVEEARAHLASMCSNGPDQGPVTRSQIGMVYARALLADDSKAEALFQSALDEDLTSWPLYRARLLLHYGMWLRRRRRISHARMPLRAARDLLAALGATIWVERARQELRASREKQHTGTEALLELTEQELQIANMASQGLSNREIAQRLYISPRTVGSHLYRIYPKLGVSSRLQLSTVLDEREPTDLAS